MDRCCPDRCSGMRSSIDTAPWGRSSSLWGCTDTPDTGLNRKNMLTGIATKLFRIVKGDTACSICSGRNNSCWDSWCSSLMSLDNSRRSSHTSNTRWKILGPSRNIGLGMRLSSFGCIDIGLPGRRCSWSRFRCTGRMDWCKECRRFVQDRSLRGSCWTSIYFGIEIVTGCSSCRKWM